MSAGDPIKSRSPRNNPAARSASCEWPLRGRLAEVQVEHRRFRFCPFSAVCRAPPGLSQARTFRLFRVSLETSLEGGLCGKGFGLQSLGAKGLARANIEQAISLFERALALDPQSIEAQSRLASILANRVTLGMTDSVEADIARADVLISQVLAASPRDWLAHWAKAQVLRTQRRCQEAIPEYETALALNRNGVAALNGLGWCKLYTGSLEEVIPIVQEAIRLTPPIPPSGFGMERLGSFICCNHDSTRLFFGSKRRAARFRDYLTITSSPPMLSEAIPSAPRRNSRKPGG